MALKLKEEIYSNTYGTHVYMRIRMDNGAEEEIDTVIPVMGEVSYRTTADGSPDIRDEIIKLYNELY